MKIFTTIITLFCLSVTAGSSEEAIPKKELIAAKLRVFDLVMEKNPKAIQNMMMSYANYARQEIERKIALEKDPSRSQFLQEALMLADMKKSGIEKMPPEKLAEMLNQQYLRLYKDREAFESDLKNPETNFLTQSPTHYKISLPLIKEGNNIQYRSLDAYFIDGKWH